MKLFNKQPKIGDTRRGSDDSIEEYNYVSQIDARAEINRRINRGDTDYPTMPPLPLSRKGPGWIRVK